MATKSVFEHVFQPISIGDVTVKNRICRTAHGTGFARDGRIGDGLIAYHVTRARGGVGLSILEIAGVHPLNPYMINATHDGVIDEYRKIVEAVRPHGMRLFQQLHAGHGPTGGWYRAIPSPLSASAVTVPLSGFLPLPMTTTLIEEHVEAFAAAARRCREGGLDGVEIHSGHGYLVGSFLSPITNVRTDAYGGSPENRRRFLTEILVAVRREVGSDFPVGVRLSADEGIAGGLVPDDVAAVVDHLTAASLVDVVDITNGSYYKMERIFSTAIAPHRYEMPYSAPIARRSAVPTIVTGRFLTLAEADETIAAGDADMVSMVRALLADPDLVRKSADGRAREVRPCIGCNQGCLGGAATPLGLIACTVNAGAGREHAYREHLQPRADTPRHVVVVGGGPGGLEAARVAAELGHRVELHEAAGELGGQLRHTRRSALRSDTATVIDYWQTELERLAVEVVCDSELDADAVRARNPDVVIVATGSRPATDGRQIWRPGRPIEGWGTLPALTSWDIMSGAAVSGAVVVYDDDGHYEGIDVTERLLSDGVTVHHATRFAMVGGRMEGGVHGWETIVRPHQRWMFERRGFTLHANAVVDRVTPHGVTLVSLDSADRTENILASAIVLVGTKLPDHSLADDLRAAGVEVAVVGDANGVRSLEGVVQDGYLAAVSIGAGFA